MSKSPAWNGEPLAKLAYDDSIRIFERFEPTEALAQLREESTVGGVQDIAQLPPGNAVEQLRKQGLYLDALNLMVHGLAVREGIWWAAQVMRATRAPWNTEQVQILDLVVQWVQQPAEAKRRQLDDLAEKMGIQSPPSFLAKAVFFSGAGSIGLADGPHVAPSPFLYAKMLFGALALVPVAEQEADIANVQADYSLAFDLGFQVAKGDWPVAPSGSVQSATNSTAPHNSDRSAS